MNSSRLIILAVVLAGCAPGLPAQVAPLGGKAPAAPVATPVSLPGAETFIYRDGQPEPMRLHVFKPQDWEPGDRRPGFIHFFGGGFLRGTPLQSAGRARAAARRGLVGIAPDYRVTDRFGTHATASVADARAALRWVQEHADELGLDPERIVVSGSSAGGHLALWTAIAASPPGSSPDEAPLHQPAALILLSAAADTSEATGQRGARFGGFARELSPLQHLDMRMPPVLMFHGDADTVVPYRHAVALHAALTASGNACELVTVPGGSHSFASDSPEWKAKIPAMEEAFLKQLGLLPVVGKSPP